MKTLELKHLVPYWPYNLKARSKKQNGDYYIGIVEEISISEQMILSYDFESTNGIWAKFEDTKLFLHPLSDLKTEANPPSAKTQCLFEWEGEIYDISDKFREIMDLIWKSQLNSNSSVCINKTELYDWCVNKTLTLPYYIIEKLFEWHFDVFGLIEQGLAIDINTLKN